MSTSKNRALIGRFYEEVWNQGNLHTIEEMCATEFCHHDIVGRDTYDLASFRQYVAATYAAFPDLDLALGEMIAEGDKVVAHWTLHGTHRGACLGIAPTGKRVELRGISIYRIADDQIIESTIYRERMDLKLGCKVVRPPAKAA
jgi:steroid delta-isomerase-like uncharacterized protein